MGGGIFDSLEQDTRSDGGLSFDGDEDGIAGTWAVETTEIAAASTSVVLPSEPSRATSELPPALHLIDQENVSGVLRKLDSIRQLAGDAQVLRRKEIREQNTRRLHVAQLYSLLLEEAEFNPQAVKQRNVQEMMEGIMLQHAEVLFFSIEDQRRKLATGPSMRLRDIANRPHRYAERLLVDQEILSRMLTEVSTPQIMEVVAKCTEYLTFKQTTYQIKRVEEKDGYVIKNASGLAIYKTGVYITDTWSHCIWRLAADRFTAQGNHEVELFAGTKGSAGLKDGPRLEAKFRSPMGIAICEQSALAFVVDTDNHTIRQINLRTNDVTTIEITLVPVGGCVFRQPKGICVIHGEAEMFSEMEAWHERQLEDFRRSLQPPAPSAVVVEGASAKPWEQADSNAAGTPGLFSDHGSTEENSEEAEEGSSEDSEGASGTGSGTSSEASWDSAASSSRSQSGLMGQITVNVINVTGTNTPPTKGQPHSLSFRQPTKGLPLSLEQSLSFQHMKKYSVLQGVDKELELPQAPPPPQQANAEERGGAARPFSKATTFEEEYRGSHSHKHGLEAPVRDDDTFDSAQERIRLAVTSDHCVWIIHPLTGRTRLIAGNTEHYGYNDAPNGLAAKFSSPRGLISVRSVLFVADYWNNVVRCVNLFSTQVDTVLNFHPQGPVAMCLSHAGNLHVLDCDNVHYTNILRIMSSPGGHEAGSNSSHIPTEDRWWYQSLFEAERTRSDSVTSAMTYQSEVWDTIRRQNLSRDGQLKELKAKEDVATLPSDFHGKLHAYLKQAEMEQRDKDERRKENRKKTAKKRRKKREGSPKGKDKEASFCGSKRGSQDPLAHPAPAIQIQGVSDEEKGGPPDNANLLQPRTSLSTTAGGNTETRSTSSQAESAPSAPSTNSLGMGSWTFSADRTSIKLFRAPHTSPIRSQASSPSDDDYVEKAKSRLMQMYSSAVDSTARNVTLSDLGVGNIGSRRQSLAQNLKGVHENRMNIGGIGALQYMLGDYGSYRTFHDGGSEEATFSPDAGTVMVKGGKAFYRSRTSSAWSQVQGRAPTLHSATTSRRASMATALHGPDEGLGLYSHQARQVGEDEEGNSVIFMDLTWNKDRWAASASRRGSMAVDLSNLWDSSGPTPAGGRSPKTTLAAIGLGTQRESSYLHQHQYQHQREPYGATGSRRPSNANGGGFSSRRQSRLDEALSLGAVGGLMMGLGGGGAASAAASRRGSLWTAGSRRGSYMVDVGQGLGGPDMESRRASILGSSRRGSVDPRVSSMGVAVEQRAGAMGAAMGSRRGSVIAGAAQGSLTSRRGSLVGNQVLGTLNDAMRLSLPPVRSDGRTSLDRRASVSVGENRRGSVLVMPTLFDTQEEEAEAGSEIGSFGKTSEEEEDEEKAAAVLEETPEEAENGEEEEDQEADLLREEREEDAEDEEEDAGDSQGAQDGGEGGAGRSRDRPGIEDADGASSPLQGGRPDAGLGVVVEEATPTTRGKRGHKGRSAWSTASSTEALGAPSLSSASVKSLDFSSISSDVDSRNVVSLAQVPFTRDIDLTVLSDKVSQNEPVPVQSFLVPPMQPSSYPSYQEELHDSTRRSIFASNMGTYKVAESKTSKIWRRMPLPETLSSFMRGKEKRYPNTPLSIAWYEQGSDCFLFVGLIYFPTLLKIIPPKLHEPDKGGRFNVLPIDAQRILLSDEGCNQIWLVNLSAKTKRHLAGCGKRGFVDGPLEICQMSSPCSMTLDPHSHHIYIADKGNHVIRKVDVLTGLMTTVVGSGSRGNYDGPDRRRQALDSPFEVSFSEPHFLIISCADNSVRSFNLKTGYLETLLVGS